MTATAKFICPICNEEIYVDWCYLKRERFRGAICYSFECPTCKIKLGFTPDDFEHNRVDG